MCSMTMRIKENISEINSSSVFYRAHPSVLHNRFEPRRLDIHASGFFSSSERGIEISIPLFKSYSFPWAVFTIMHSISLAKLLIITGNALCRFLFLYNLVRLTGYKNTQYDYLDLGEYLTILAHLLHLLLQFSQRISHHLLQHNRSDINTLRMLYLPLFHVYVKISNR